MTWSDEEAEWVAEAYHADYVLSQAADPVPREVRDQHWWAGDRVQDAGMEGTLTIRVVDALLRAGELDEAYRGYVAVGPLEDLLGDHGGKFDSEVTARCKVDTIWAEAAQGV